MKFSFYLLIFALLLLVSPAIAQKEVLSDNHFPADGEFVELHQTSEVVWDDPALLVQLKDGRLIEDVGFENYQRRSYTTGNSRSVSIEIISLKDYYASYSLLTLLRESALQNGPPGDVFTATPTILCFAKNKEWVRIQADGVQKDLLMRIAQSISNRLGNDPQRIPSLVSYLPKTGYVASSLRFFPGLKSFETFSGNEATVYEKLNMDMEIAQAHYFLDNCSGDLSLLSFPTDEIAEDCFSVLSDAYSVDNNGNTVYMKMAGPFVAILKGDFEPLAADNILRSITHSYTIRWDSNEPTLVWGIPSTILRTVVVSFLAVILLCIFSIITGAAFTLFRFILRKRSSHNIIDRQSEITQLRLQ